MAIKMNSIKCPECNATLPIEEGRSQCFCSYCGAKIIITNENEHIYRHINEAKVKQAETERLVELKRLELEEKKRKTETRIRILKIVITILLGIVAAVCFAIRETSDGKIWPMTYGFLCLNVILWMWVYTINKNRK